VVGARQQPEATMNLATTLFTRLNQVASGFSWDYQ